MENPTSAGNKARGFLFENRVPLMFAVICIFAFWASGMTTVMFFNELSVRIGRDTFLVLSLLIPVIAGLGLNFGIIIGAMAAQIAMFFVILFGGSGATGLFTVAVVATPIAIVLGYLIGRLFNQMKGSEMIGGLITGLFANGFYQFLLLFIMGGVIPVVLVADMEPTFLYNVLGDLSMLSILIITFVIVVLVVLVKFLQSLVKKKALGRGPLIALAVVGIPFVATGFGGWVFRTPLTNWLASFVPVTGERVMTGTGIGVLNVLDLGASPTYMRQAWDNVSMLNILNVAFWVMLIAVAALFIIRLLKKEPIVFKGPRSVTRPLVVFALLFVAFVASGFAGFVFQTPLTFFLYQDRLNALHAVQIGALVTAVYMLYSIVRAKIVEKRPGLPTAQLTYLILAAVILLTSFAYIIYHSLGAGDGEPGTFIMVFFREIYLGLSSVGLPVFTYLIILGLCVFIKWFLNTRLGQNMRTVGQSRPVATAAGINVDKTRIIAMIMSTVLASYGHIINLQNFGIMNTYAAHEFIGLFSIAALLVGGATVARASIKHAVMGVILFHSLFILSPFAGANLMDSALIGEYFRSFVAYAVIAVALVMHAWQRTKPKAPRLSMPVHPPPAEPADSADAQA